MNKIELLQEYKEQEEYNLHCYNDPRSWEDKPQKGYEKEWKNHKEKIKLIKEMISDEIEIRSKQKSKNNKER